MMIEVIIIEGDERYWWYMDVKTDFDRLIDEAQQAHFAGWDFSWLAGRKVEAGLPWNYRELVIAYMQDSEAMLDMDTGGGEFLAELPFRSPLTCATENYPPNIPIAKARLGQYGIRVYQNESDCNRLPFDDRQFDLVINRHGDYDLTEIWRVLRPGGVFLTQQVGANNEIELNQYLAPSSQPIYSGEEFAFEKLIHQCKQGGFAILRAESAGVPSDYLDIGAVVYQLKVISWQIPDFSVAAYRDRLLAIHAMICSEGKFTTTEERYLLIAQKPA
jgi:SAM-dependent methyltransferase